MQNPFKKMGPATLVAAAFIGPGTVTACMKAGQALECPYFGLYCSLVYDYFIQRRR